MKEMNFFNEFLLQKAKARARFIKIVVIAVAFVAILAGVWLFFIAIRIAVDAELAELETALAHPKYAEAKIEIARIEQRLVALNTYYNSLSELDRRISTFHKLDPDENYEIMRAFPEGVYLRNLSIDGLNLNISALAVDINLIPATIQNLYDTGLFFEILPPSTTLVSTVMDAGTQYVEYVPEEYWFETEDDNGETIMKADIYDFTIRAVFNIKEVD